MKEILPLRIKDLGTNIFILDKNLNPITDVVTSNRAEFIVRACNSHYDLLEACKKAVFNIHGYTELPIKARIQLQQAIAKAEGK